MPKLFSIYVRKQPKKTSNLNVHILTNDKITKTQHCAIQSKSAV